MFAGCKELEFLNLSNFDTSKVTNMNFIFDDCFKLKKIKGIEKFNKTNAPKNNNNNFQGGFFNFFGQNFFKNNINNNNNNIQERLQDQLYDEKNKNLKLLEELNMQKKRMNYLISTNEEVIAIVFRSTDQNINYPFTCKESDKFSNVEEKLYNEFPELKNKNIIFLANGNAINREDTIRKNGIKNGTTIIMQYN